MLSGLAVLLGFILLSLAAESSAYARAEPATVAPPDSVPVFDPPLPASEADDSLQALDEVNADVIALLPVGIWGDDNLADDTPPARAVAPIPTATAPSPTNPSPAPSAPAKPLLPQPPAKWIDVNLSKQTITAYVGTTPLKTVLVSTGVAQHPTIVGWYKIYAKVPSQRMTGGRRGVDYYSIPNVPNVMFFYGDYAIHGAYWHHNFGHPMSYGCVNLSLSDAAWFYAWAVVGTPVHTHL